MQLNREILGLVTTCMLKNVPHKIAIWILASHAFPYPRCYCWLLCLRIPPQAGSCTSLVLKMWWKSVMNLYGLWGSSLYALLAYTANGLPYQLVHACCEPEENESLFSLVNSEWTCTSSWLQSMYSRAQNHTHIHPHTCIHMYIIYVRTYVHINVQHTRTFKRSRKCILRI